MSTAWLDALRYFVMAQGVIVLGLYAFSLSRGTIGLVAEHWRAGDQVDRVATQVRIGRLVEILVVAILVLEETMAVCDRLGQEELTHRTPVLQLVFLLMLVSWGLMHSRKYRHERRSSESQVQRAMEHLES